MKIKIKRIDKTLPMPAYETSGACCFDLYSRIDMTVAPHEIALIPTNIIIVVPEGYMFVVAPRSSTPRKKGLLSPHGIGIIDQDYQGEKDEVLFQAYNFTEKEVVITKGERIAQGCVIAIAKPELVEVTEVTSKTRGGIGSTG